MDENSNEISFKYARFPNTSETEFQIPAILAPLKMYSIPSMYVAMARYLHTNPLSSTALQRFMAQGHNLWWREASCTCRAFWQHSEFLVSAALAGR